MTDYILETRELVKRFGRGKNQQTAVNQVSLHVETGKIYGLLGSNGAGKSTTLKMITGMRPTAGEIRPQGRPYPHRSATHGGYRGDYRQWATCL